MGRGDASIAPMSRRALLLVSLAAFALLSDSVQAAAPTTVHTTLRLPASATLGVPFNLTVKVTNRGPGVAGAIEVEVGVEKVTGPGAHPGLIVGPWMNEKRHIARLAAGQSATLTFKVRIAATLGKGGTIGDTIFGGGGYYVGPGLNIGSPAGAKWTGAGTNASSPNITLVVAHSY